MKNYFFVRYQSHKKHLANMIAAAALAAGMSVGSAQATSITVPNANLEHMTLNSPGSNYGSYVPSNGDSWTGAAYSGNVNHDYVPGFFTATPTPTASSYIGVPISQTLTTKWAAGTYVLSAFAVTDNPGSLPTLIPTLQDGGVAVGTPTTTSITAPLDSAGTFASSTIVVPFGSPDIGQFIEITFGGHGRTFFDQIALDFTVAVPEPGTVSLLGTGIVGMALATLRRHWRSQR